jgi:hypothetical protein
MRSGKKVEERHYFADCTLYFPDGFKRAIKAAA